MSERQLTQAALLVANYMTRGQYDSEVDTWGYYTKSAFRKFLNDIQITDVLREHLNSGVYHYVDELPTEVANALLAKGPDEVITTDGSLQAPQDPEQNNSEQDPETETNETSEDENDENEETEDSVEDQPEETSEETEKSEDAQDAEESSEEKPKARRSRRS